MVKTVIVKVRENKRNKQKSVTIPKEARNIKKGDYVRITKTR